MSNFRKKPVVIEARQLVTQDYNYMHGLAEWCGGEVSGDGSYSYIAIHTLEGYMFAGEGDWIIKGVKGEFYPCKPDIFEATYEQVDE